MSLYETMTQNRVYQQIRNPTIGYYCPEKTCGIQLTGVPKNCPRCGTQIHGPFNCESRYAPKNVMVVRKPAETPQIDKIDQLLALCSKEQIAQFAELLKRSVK